MKYEIVDDITSDVKFRAYGKTHQELFENSALALSSIFCDTKNVKNNKTIEISAEGENIEDLMINWLNQILATVDIEEMFFCGFKINNINDKQVSGVAMGDEMTPELGLTVAKAITNFNYELKKTNDGYVVQVVVDI